MKVHRLLELLHFCDPEDDVCVEGDGIDLDVIGIQWCRDDALLLLQTDIEDYLEEEEEDDTDAAGNVIDGECCSVGGRDDAAPAVEGKSRIKQLE